MKRNIYCISGLGADERLFERLYIPDSNLIYVHWQPYSDQDDLVSYAHRLAPQIKEHNAILMGVSFGGMLAIELAKLLNSSKVFIISSIKDTSDFPQFYLFANRIHLIPLIPSFLIKRPNTLLDYAFGANTKASKVLLHDYLTKANVAYIKWALQAILSWKNHDIPPLIHIHGTADRVIPLPKTTTHKISGGGHLMVYDRAKEISDIISKELNKLDLI